MTLPRRSPSNIPASVHARLLRLSKEAGQDFNLILVRFASERLLYRLSQSRHGDRFILKGAWMFYVWDLQRRVTRDVDLLGSGNADVEAMADVFREALAVEVEPDGIEFDITSVEVAAIREDAAYPGLRVRVLAHLGPARLTCQADIGFGDALVEQPVKTELPSLLDLPAPEFKVYPVEALVAEKIEAMVRLGGANTRLKDYFDLYVLATERELDTARLGRQLGETFRRRGTPIPTRDPEGISGAFGADPERNARWRAFLKRSGGVATVPADFRDVVDRIRTLVLELFEKATGTSG